MNNLNTEADIVVPFLQYLREIKGHDILLEDELAIRLRADGWEELTENYAKQLIKMLGGYYDQ